MFGRSFTSKLSAFAGPAIVMAIVMAGFVSIAQADTDCPTCEGDKSSASPFEALEKELERIRLITELDLPISLVRGQPVEVRPGVLQFQLKVGGQESQALKFNIELDSKGIKGIAFDDVAKAKALGLEIGPDFRIQKTGPKGAKNNIDLVGITTSQPGWLGRQATPGQRILEIKVRESADGSADTARFQYGIEAGRVSYIQPREDSYARWTKDYNYQPTASSREDEWLLHFNIPIIGDILNLDGKKRNAIFEQIQKTLQASLPEMGLTLSPEELSRKAWEITQFATRADIVGRNFAGGKPKIELAASVESYRIFGDMALAKQLRDLVPAGTSESEIQKIVTDVTASFKACLNRALADRANVNKANAEACLDIFKRKVPVEVGRRVLELQVKAQTANGILKGLNGQTLALSAARNYERCIESKFINKLPGNFKLDYGYQIIQACTFRSLSETLEAHLGEVLKTQLAARAATSPLLGKLKLTPQLVRTAEAAAHNCLGRYGYVAKDALGADPLFDALLTVKQDAFLKTVTGTCLNEMTGLIGEIVVRTSILEKLVDAPFDEKVKGILIEEAIRTGYRPCVETLLKVAGPSTVFNPERCAPLIQTQLLKAAVRELLLRELGKSIPAQECFDNHIAELTKKIPSFAAKSLSDTQFAAIEKASEVRDVACIKDAIQSAAAEIGKDKVREALAGLAGPPPEAPLEISNEDLKFIGDKLAACVGKKLGDTTKLAEILKVKFDTIKSDCTQELAADGDVRKRAFAPIVRAQLKDLKVSKELENTLIDKLLLELGPKIQDIIVKAIGQGQKLGPEVVEGLKSDAVRILSKTLAKEEALDLINDPKFAEALGLTSDAERESFREKFSDVFRDNLIECQKRSKAPTTSECVLEAKIATTKWVGEQVLNKELTKPEHAEMFKDSITGKDDPALRTKFVKEILESVDNDVTSHFQKVDGVKDTQKVKDSFQMLVSRLSTEAVRAIAVRSAETAWASVLPLGKYPGITQSRDKSLGQIKPELNECLDGTHARHRRAITLAKEFDQKAELAPCLNRFQMRVGLDLAKTAIARRFPILTEAKYPNTVIAGFEKRAMGCLHSQDLKQDPPAFSDRMEECLAAALFPVAKELVRFRRTVPEFATLMKFDESTERATDACLAKVEKQWNERLRLNGFWVRTLAENARANKAATSPSNLDWLLENVESCAVSPLVPSLIQEIRGGLIEMVRVQWSQGKASEEDFLRAKGFLQSVFASNEHFMDELVRGKIKVTHDKKPGKGVDAVEFLLSKRLPDLMQKLAGHKGSAAEFLVDLMKFNRGHEEALKAEYSEVMDSVEARIHANGGKIDIDEIAELFIRSRLTDRLAKFGLARTIREQIQPYSDELGIPVQNIDQATSLKMMERLFGPTSSSRGSVQHPHAEKLLNDNWKDIEEYFQESWTSKDEAASREDVRLLKERDKLSAEWKKLEAERLAGGGDQRWQRKWTAVKGALESVRATLTVRERDEKWNFREFHRAGGTLADLQQARGKTAASVKRGFRGRNGNDILQTFKTSHAPDFAKRLLRGENVTAFDKEMLSSLQTEVLNVLTTDVDLPNGRGPRGSQEGIVFLLAKAKVLNELNAAMDDQGLVDLAVPDSRFYLSNVIKTNGGIVAFDAISLQMQEMLSWKKEGKTPEEIRQHEVYMLFLKKFSAVGFEDGISPY